MITSGKRTLTKQVDSNSSVYFERCSGRHHGRAMKDLPHEPSTRAASRIRIIAHDHETVKHVSIPIDFCKQKGTKKCWRKKKKKRNNNIIHKDPVIDSRDIRLEFRDLRQHHLMRPRDYVAFIILFTLSTTRVSLVGTAPSSAHRSLGINDSTFPDVAAAVHNCNNAPSSDCSRSTEPILESGAKLHYDGRKRMRN